MTGFKIIFLAGIEKKFEAGVRGGCPRMPVAEDFFDDAIQIRYITPAIKYLKIVIPAKAGIQEYTGCRIKSGMTE